MGSRNRAGLPSAPAFTPGGGLAASFGCDVQLVNTAVMVTTTTSARTDLTVRSGMSLPRATVIQQHRRAGMTIHSKLNANLRMRKEPEPVQCHGHDRAFKIPAS